MSLNCGIVGPPNVGKSTIFNALTSNIAEVANYPFCTINPNVGMVTVADPRLLGMNKVLKKSKVIPTTVEFVDIAGLVKGASEGEGLGNQFLGHVRQVNTLLHVVRCFEDQDVAHVGGKIDPKSDIEIVNLELVMADLEVVVKRINNFDRLLKSKDPNLVKRAKISRPILERLRTLLEEGKMARSLDLDEQEHDVISDLNLMTLKKILYVCNVGEDDLTEDNRYVREVKRFAEKEKSEMAIVCGKIESEINSLESEEEKLDFYKSLNINQSGLDKIVQLIYQQLQLGTFYTHNEEELRAWTFKIGTKAQEAAGMIHTDFKKGFIKAEIYNYDDLITLGTEAKIREKGRIKIEGRDYQMKDGDVVLFRFNI